MDNNLNSSSNGGLTASEKYLNKLSRHSFLSLWSFPNLYTDEGRKGSEGAGHELCDLLVLFGNDLLLFSVKDIKFSTAVLINVAWHRWFKRAVQKSATQIFGAESWIKLYPDRIFTDPRCQHRFPLPIPPISKLRVHRICVALGCYEACRDYFGNGSFGSLVVDTTIRSAADHIKPFHIGQVNTDKGLVHVLEDFTLDVVFRELDTISDFISYLEKKEAIFGNNSIKVRAAGEEQLLARYLTNLNPAGEHDFEFPVGTVGTPAKIFLDNSHWEGLVFHEQYKAKKAADRISFAWDRLIEHFANNSGILEDGQWQEQDKYSSERALRSMAAENRLRRRQLAKAFLDLLENKPQHARNTRLVYSNDYPDVAYVFLILARDGEEEYAEYRKHRVALLSAYCQVAKLRAQEAKSVVGIATEPKRSIGSSEELLAIDVSAWSEEDKASARKLSEELELFRPDNILFRQGYDMEYPGNNMNSGHSGRPSGQTQQRCRKDKAKRSRTRRIQKASRRSNRRK